MNTSESHSNTLCRRRFLQLAATVAGTAFAPASAAGSIDNKVNSGNEPSNSLSDLEHDFYNDYTHFASASDTNSIISHANYVRRAYTSRQFSDREKKIIELLDMRYRGLAAAQLYNIALSGRCLEPERKVALLEIAEALHPRKSTKKIIGAVRADIEKEHNINKRFNSYYQGMVTRVLSDYQLQELYADSMNPSKKLDRGVKKTFDFILPGDDIVAGWKDGHLPSEPKGIDYDVNVSAYKRQTQQFMAAKGLGHLISQKNQTGRKKWEVKEFNYLDAGAVEQAVSTYNRSIAHAKLDEGQMLYSLLTDAIKFDKKRYTESDFAVLQIAQANLRASLAWKEKMAAEKTGDIAEQYAHSIAACLLAGDEYDLSVFSRMASDYQGAMKNVPEQRAKEAVVDALYPYYSPLAKERKSFGGIKSAIGVTRVGGMLYAPIAAAAAGAAGGSALIAVVGSGI